MSLGDVHKWRHAPGGGVSHFVTMCDKDGWVLRMSRRIKVSILMSPHLIILREYELNILNILDNELKHFKLLDNEVSQFYANFTSSYNFLSFIWNWNFEGRKLCDVIFEGVWPFVMPCDYGGQKPTKKAWRHLWTAPWLATHYSKWLMKQQDY